MFFIIEVLKNISDYKWFLAVLGILGPWVIFIVKTWIDNYNNSPLEKILNSNLTNFYKELFIYITIFVSAFFLLLLSSSNIIGEMIEKSSVGLVFSAFLLADIVLTFTVVVIFKIFSYFIDPKYDYFIIFKDKEVNEDNEWKLIKQSGKRGYLIKNNKGEIDFIYDVSIVKFREVERKRTELFKASRKNNLLDKK
ncbi:hypothetical protein [Psychrobacillus phage Spoks]|nr:hypothetical protein [Psychrobacillus phage Spoks]